MKLARKHGVESLLPFTVKKTEERLSRRLEHGLRVKGTGVGEKVRGKIQERTLKSRYVLLFLWRGAVAMRKMRIEHLTETFQRVMGSDLPFLVLQRHGVVNGAMFRPRVSKGVLL